MAFQTARVPEYRATARFITGVLGSVAYKDEFNQPFAA
jgi:hypothetical protein